MLPNESFKNFGHPVEKDGARKDTQGVMQPPTGRGWCGQQRTLLTHLPTHLHSTRISDIRLFIVDARPAMAATSFVLMTTFPNKELADESQTLKEANLLNAVIVQRLT